MKPFILSNRGRVGSAESSGDEQVSCDPAFLNLLAAYFSGELKSRNLPSVVYLNLVMRGGYICRRYSTWRNENELRSHGIACEVQSLQLEYDTLITHDQIALESNPEKMKDLQLAFSSAITLACDQYIKTAN